MSLLTLAEAADFLESVGCTAAIPREASSSVQNLQSSSISYSLVQQTTSEDVSLQERASDDVSFGQDDPFVNHDAAGVRRSGGAGTREVHNKLEKNRRAHLKECFENLRREIPVAENRKTSNLSILRLAIKHIKNLEERHKQLTNIQSEEKRQNLQFEKILHLGSSLSGASFTKNLDHPNTSSPSTDTASDSPIVSDDDTETCTINKEPVATMEPLVPQLAPTQCTGMSNIILLCPTFNQKIPSVQGTVIIPPPISSNPAIQPVKPSLSVSTKSVSAAADLSSLVPPPVFVVSQVNNLVTLSSALSKVSKPSISNDNCRINGLLKNSGTVSVVAKTSSETVASSSSLGNNRTTVVQMLQQTITQRAIVQQEKQRLLLSQNQQQRGSATSMKTVGFYQPATLALVSANGQAISAPTSISSSLLPSIASYSSASRSSSSAILTSSTSDAFARSTVRSFPEAIQMESLPAAEQSTLPGAAMQTVTNSLAPHHILSINNSLPEASLVSSSMLLQLMSHNNLGKLQTRSLDDVPQSVGHLVAIYPMVSSIPFTQFVTPVTVVPPTIPVLSALRQETSYRQDVLGTLLQATVAVTSVDLQAKPASSLLQVETNLPTHCSM